MNERAYHSYTQSAASGGNTYVRWGRKTCPVNSDATLLYEGFVAGGGYDLYTAGGKLL